MRWRAPILGASLALVAFSHPAVAQEPADQFPAFQGFLFGDVAYLATERDIPESFVLGQVVGHANAALSDRLTVFSEASARGTPTGYAFEIERVVIRYDFSDRVRVSAGRYHTPIMYWNTAFHHGAWLQSSVARPEMIKFGSRFLPVHFVGAMVSGGFPSNQLGLSYRLGVGNGRASNIARAGDAGDTNGRPAFVASLSAQPASPFGLRFGLSAYFDRVSPEVGSEANEQIFSVHMLWDQGPPELLAEYVRINHDPLSGGPDRSSDAFYVQAAMRLTGDLDGLKPYARYEWIGVADLDPVFPDVLEDYSAALVGLRYDFEQLAALKAELRQEEFGDDDRNVSLYVQVSFAVPGIGGGAGT